MIRALFLTLLVGSLATACASKSDIADLESSMIEEIRSLDARQESLASEIRELRGALIDTLGAQERQVLTGRGELNRRLQRLSERMAQLTELAGQNQRLLAQLRAEGVPSRAPGGGPEGLPEEEDGESADTIRSEADTTPAEPGGPGGDAGAQELYEASLQQLRRGSFETARAGLGEFLELYPDHELAPDAQFYIAETYVRGEDPDAALEEYARVLELYPESRRAPSALYRSGLVELERDNVSDALSFFSRVVRGYPESDEAELARDQMDRLED